jgi:hypothetical protein
MAGAPMASARTRQLAHSVGNEKQPQLSSIDESATRVAYPLVGKLIDGRGGRNEITDNILIHAAAEMPGAVCAQYFESQRRLDVAIVDCGRGLKASLEEAMPILSHGDAISKAILRGVTRNPAIGMGNGLAGSVDIVAANRGSMKLWTGDMTLEIAKGKHKGFVQQAAVPGTGVFFRLQAEHPVNLEETFIGAKSWTYLEAESQRISQTGGIQIAQECAHTGSRVPAKALRQKVQSLLPDMEGPLVLDFAGVRSASSSFLDELLGRLVAQSGPAEFKHRVEVINLNRHVQAIANVVIEQRMGGDHS